MFLFIMKSRVSGARLAVHALAVASAFSFQSHATEVLPETVVTATRTPVKSSDVIGDVRVIDRETLDQSAGLSVAEILRQHGGVQVSSNGGLGKSSSLYVRGSESKHVLLLIDGVRYGSATQGAPNWDNLPLALIDRIEVLRGPAAGLYGSDAVGGVVQVFTRRSAGSQPELFLSTTWGSYGRRELSGGVQGVHDGLSYSLALASMREDGFSATNASIGGSFNPDRDGFSQQSLHANLNWRVSPSLELSLQTLVATGDNQYDSSSNGSVNFDVHGLTTTRVSGLGMSKVWDGGGKTRLSIGQADDLTRNRLRTADTRFDTRRLQWSVQHDQPSAVGLLSAGVDSVKENIDSTRIYPVTQRRIDGLFAGLQGRQDAHRWQANVRSDANSQFGHATTGSIGYGFDWRPSWSLTGAAAKSFKAPTFNQLYWWPASGSYVGNPDLKPERGQSVELGVRYESAHASLALVHHAQRIRDLIPSSQNVNIARAEISGWGLDGHVVQGSWKIGGQLELLDARNKTPGANFNRKLQRRADEQLTLSVERAVAGWWLGAHVLMVSDRFDDLANTRRLPGYGMLSLSAERALGADWRLQVRLNNAGDKVYETAYGYNQPGRALYTTLNWRPQR